MKLSFPERREFDVLTLGRANVDLYPPPGERLNAARHYQAFVGGSPANVAVGMSCRGLRSALISRVAADAHGDFVCSYLQGLGVDVSQVQRDHQGHPTSLAFAERRPDALTLLYRHRVADLQLQADELDNQLFARARLLFLSGAAASTEPSRSAVHRAVQLARSAGCLVVLDIDYRPYNWASDQEAAEVLGGLVKQCEIVLGTRKEFSVAGVGDDDDDLGCAQRCKRAQLVVVKHDKEGANAFLLQDGELMESRRGVVFPVEVCKPWGAGDAFASSLLASLLEGEELSLALQHAAAAASINISGFSCTEAMASRSEIEQFIRRNHARSYSTVR